MLTPYFTSTPAKHNFSCCSISTITLRVVTDYIALKIDQMYTEDWNVCWTDQRAETKE